jgi:heme exporter protein B
VAGLWAHRCIGSTRFRVYATERMMSFSMSTRCLWWLIHKDFIREIRALQSWPRTLLIGMVMVLLLAAQIDLAMDRQIGAVSGLIWITIFFSATVSIERSFASERNDGCWPALQQFPISPSVIFLAKAAVNSFTTSILALVLIAMFVVLTDIPLLARPGWMAVVAVLGSLGFAAVGTLASAVTASVRDGGGLLILVLLPLATPILLSSAEATRILLTSPYDPLWWWWIHLLAAFAVIFTVVGMLVVNFAMEE